ncbi:CHASE domain-containing protein [Parasphingopyxis marina]|uniref:histidine kinase n=1 Tax=Parasphingopyxis marina TaxID=2761622 RepID=A0A842HZZ8_9SPHN|nr:CHASE domain-containing protein [Parasphingopyxis marina]MBC2778455.1 CHASE domain-containing protein [Parasphingopyxis marina]
MNLSLHRAFPVGVFAVGLIVSALIAFQIANFTDDRLEERFAHSADMAVTSVENRIDMQMTLLRGTAGLFHSSDSVTAQDFETFVDWLDLEHNYPGVLGVGFAAAAPDRETLSALAAERQPDRAIANEAWPLGDRAAYSTILYLEPQNVRNAEAIGFDMMSEETRRAAMMRAARTGETIMSGRVELVQEIDSEKQPGFLIYTPLYSDDTAARTGTPYGWVYSPLRAHDMFREVFPENAHADLAVSIYDGPVAPENLLFRSSQETGDRRYRRITTLTLAGHEWTIEAVALPSFAQSTTSFLPWVVGFGGALVALLLAILFDQQVRAAARIEEKVSQRTAELNAANTRLHEEVAARAKAETEVMQMQRMESLGQLTGGIAHDFNNMLAVVMGNLELARLNVSNPERLEKLIHRATIGALRASDLTQRLLAFARRQPLTPSKVDVNALVGEMSEMLERTIGKRVNFSTELADDLWPTLVDGNQLENALLNLVINARDAMEDGDALVIRTANGQHRIAENGQNGDLAECVCISVYDSGAGMTEEVREQALEPFFTTKAIGKGTGLGLSQVFGFARQSGGDLEIDTEEGKGTTIRIFLPRLQGAQAGDTDEAGEGPAEDAVARGLQQEVVLVVDDEEEVRTMTVEMLRELGYSVVAASGGEEALRRLASHPEIRVVLTDIVMPEMNGNEFASHALSAVPDLKFVFVSGYDNPAEPVERLENGVIARLRKPFGRDVLARAIRTAFDQNADVAWPAPDNGSAKANTA